MISKTLQRPYLSRTPILLPILLTTIYLGACSQNSSISTSSSQRAKPAPPATLSDQQVEWKEQGLTITLPPSWSKTEFEFANPIPDTMNWKDPLGARLLVDVLNGRQVSSPDKELQTEYEGVYLQKQGKFEEVRYLTLDGVKGLFRRSSDEERVSLHWDAFRKHQGKFQYLNIYLSVPRDSFKLRQSELYGILHSIKFAGE